MPESIFAVPAEKWKANANPENDAAVVNALQEIIATVKTDLFVLISTIDVYELGNTSKHNEDTDSSSYMDKHHAYGKNRFLFEKFVMDKFPRHVILRLPALHGPFLKKNYVYDLLNDNGVDRIKRNSCFQWYDLTRLNADIETALAAGISVVNLFPEPVWTSDLIRIAEETGVVSTKVTEKIPQVVQGAAEIIYRVFTKHGQTYGAPSSLDFIYSAEESLSRLRRYFLTVLVEKKVVFSNIAWDWSDSKENEPVLDALLHKYRIRQLEIAPTKIWGVDWAKVKEALTNGQAKAFGDRMRAMGFQVPSYQAILYACPECQLVKDQEGTDNFIKHMKFIADLAAAITLDSPAGSKTRPPALVLGAPKNRLMFGQTVGECDAVAEKALRELGDYAWSKHVVIVMEANPPAYGCEYLNTATTAAAMVRKVDSPGFRLHVDLACMFLAEEDIAQVIEANKDIIYHIHISEPYLEAIGQNDKVPHGLFASLLKKHFLHSDVRYSIEMKNGEGNVQRVTAAADFVLKTYFGLESPL